MSFSSHCRAESEILELKPLEYLPIAELARPLLGALVFGPACGEDHLDSYYSAFLVYKNDRPASYRDAKALYRRCIDFNKKHGTDVVHWVSQCMMAHCYPHEYRELKRLPRHALLPFPTVDPRFVMSPDQPEPVHGPIGMRPNVLSHILPAVCTYTNSTTKKVASTPPPRTLCPDSY